MVRFHFAFLLTIRQTDIKSISKKAALWEDTISKDGYCPFHQFPVRFFIIRVKIHTPVLRLHLFSTQDSPDREQKSLRLIPDNCVPASETNGFFFSDPEDCLRFRLQCKAALPLLFSCYAFFATVQKIRATSSSMYSRITGTTAWSAFLASSETHTPPCIHPPK